METGRQASTWLHETVRKRKICRSTTNLYRGFASMMVTTKFIWLNREKNGIILTQGVENALWWELSMRITQGTLAAYRNNYNKCFITDRPLNNFPEDIWAFSSCERTLKKKSVFKHVVTALLMIKSYKINDKKKDEKRVQQNYCWRGKRTTDLLSFFSLSSHESHFKVTNFSLRLQRKIGAVSSENAAVNE